MKTIHLGALAAAALTLSLATSPASARVDQFCGVRYCPSISASPHQSHSAGRPARHRWRVAGVRHERTRRADPDRHEASGAGIVRSRKTGVTARVSPVYRDRFQAFIDDLEAHGGAVYYMGGYRRGRCSLASQHPCGWALDVCQDYRGHVSGARDCHLPRPAEFHAIARAHGLFDGSVWRSSDYGHVQARQSAAAAVAPHGSWGHGRPHLRYARR